MATASDPAGLRGLSYNARGEAYLGHAKALEVGRPRKASTSEAAAIFYEIVYYSAQIDNVAVQGLTQLLSFRLCSNKDRWRSFSTSSEESTISVDYWWACEDKMTS